MPSVLTISIAPPIYRRNGPGKGRRRRSLALTGFDGGLESVADILGEQVESFSQAIAEHVEHSEFVECEGLFAGAVEAVNFGFEQLECAAENRNQLAAAVDRLDTAVGNQAQQHRGWQGFVSEKSSVPDELNRVGMNGRSASKETGGHDAYWQLWKYYSAGKQASNLVQLDYLVGRAAFESGRSRKEIALMLVAGSAIAKEIRSRQGAKQATHYVNKTVIEVSQQSKPARVVTQEQGKQHKWELE